MDILAYNRQAWDNLVEAQDKWTIPVDHEVIERARAGDWQIVLTPLKAVPRDWFPPALAGKQVLCLASGGGQQAAGQCLARGSGPESGAISGLVVAVNCA